MIKIDGIILRHRSELSAKRNAELDAKHAEFMKRPRKKQTAWIVFGRPVGSRVWLPAYRESTAGVIVAFFHNFKLAKAHAVWMRKHQRAYMGGVKDAAAVEACIRKVVLPK
jgi:hypothetical protein